MADNNVITCQNVSLGYGGHVVIRGLSFSVRRGGYFCVVGENGSGKSTLIKGILGLIGPLEGTIQFGKGIRKNEIGYLSQSAAAKTDFPASVYEIVLSGNLGAMGMRPFYSRREKRQAEENLRRLGIYDLKEHCYRELSGGQQRRALLARALCAGRTMLVLDEPAAGLDPLVTAEFYRLLDEINRDLGITVIMVSHDIEGTKKYASEILNLGKPLAGLRDWHTRP
ncbi:MAG: ATP-binding cassette domain-containing protein, partial [Treponema sp.]|nr:ATP-binding cassette domain-containing protein [Treponema sp.]